MEWGEIQSNFHGRKFKFMMGRGERGGEGGSQLGHDCRLSLGKEGLSQRMNHSSHTRVVVIGAVSMLIFIDIVEPFIVIVPNSIQSVFIQ